MTAGTFVIGTGCAHVLASWAALISKDVLPPLGAGGDAAGGSAGSGWRSKRSAADGPREPRSFLHLTRWDRVVFFDAGCAQNPATQRAQAAAALNASRRWAIAVAEPPPSGRRPAASKYDGLLRLLSLPAGVGSRACSSIVRDERGCVADLARAMTSSGAEGGTDENGSDDGFEALFGES